MKFGAEKVIEEILKQNDVRQGRRKKMTVVKAMNKQTVWPVNQ